MSQTPRTDAIELDPIGDSDGAMELAALARTLERENADLLEVCKIILQRGYLYTGDLDFVRAAIAKAEGK